MEGNGVGASYSTIKDWVLQCYFDGCRDLALKEGRSHAEVLGYVTYQFENSFETPAENVMCWLAQIVLSGGWYPEAETYMRQQIASQLDTHGVEGLLSYTSIEDREIMRHDLSLLNFI
ncbi:hypothetical protein DyAD56_15055 [Dyella sp. AD56]|nr:hypothetical protein DyAD56_15055 [Dyella sp. AD56]